MHFNHNLVRDVKKKADGSSQVKVIYPKFKNGVASVRDVRVEPNYGNKMLITLIFFGEHVSGRSRPA